MKRLALVFALLSTATAFALVNRFDIISGTNSITLRTRTSGYKFPLNTLILTSNSDSTKAQFLTVSAYGNSYGYTQATPLDSISHYWYNGTQLSTYRQLDSIFQIKFVK